METPFEKFTVKDSMFNYGKAVVKYWPNGCPHHGYGLEVDNSEKAAKFIEDAIREKLERTKEQHD